MAKKKATKALLCVVMDRSGSMAGKEDDVVGGINKFIEEQKAQPGEAWLTLSQFDNEFETICDSVPIKDVKPIARTAYSPRGSTSLLDAIGRSIKGLESAVERLSPDKVIVVTVTDGHENSSVEFKKKDIKSLIKDKEKDGKWSFVYFGADVNAFDEASSLGYCSSNVANYSNSRAGTMHAYSVMTCSVSELRAGNSTANLGAYIEDDGNVKKKK